jgi:hypothetical protein
MYPGVRGIYPPVFTGDNCTGHCSSSRRIGWQGLCLRRGECFYISTNSQNRKRKVARLGHKMSDFAICELVDCWRQKKGWKIRKCAIHKSQLRKSGTPYWINPNPIICIFVTQNGKFAICYKETFYKSSLHLKLSCV